MFEETRDLVYIQFAEECKFWRDEFDVHYDRCLEVRDLYIDKPTATHDETAVLF
jgi:hypothetical protein